jgi:hypothetical protein
LLAALHAGAFSFLPMLGPTVSFTNLKFNVSEFHLLSSAIYCYLSFFLWPLTLLQPCTWCFVSNSWRCRKVLSVSNLPSLSSGLFLQNFCQRPTWDVKKENIKSPYWCHHF